MADGEAIVVHARRCGNPACGARFWICDRCDRGQSYCSAACRRQARAASHRRANRRYQCSPRGRRHHSGRQSRYRGRQRARSKKIVTDTDSQTLAKLGIVEPCRHHAPPQNNDLASPRCLLCGRPAVRPGQPIAPPAATASTKHAMTEPIQSTPATAWPASLYVAWLLSLYVELPDTPARASAQDHAQAQRLFARGVPHETAETALLLASLRRLLRPCQTPPLPAIRSLAYFQPVIEELLAQPGRRGYLDYLRRKFAEAARRAPAKEPS